jgi:hypothetical protein
MLQARQGLADGAAADIEAAREVDFARQPLAGLEGAGLNAPTQPLRDALIFGNHLYEPVCACPMLWRSPRARKRKKVFASFFKKKRFLSVFFRLDRAGAQRHNEVVPALA